MIVTLREVVIGVSIRLPRDALFELFLRFVLDDAKQKQSDFTVGPTQST